MDGFKRGGGGGKRSLWVRYLLVVYLSWQLAIGVEAQPSVGSPAPAVSISNETAISPAEQSAQDQCVGVFLSYFASPPEIIPPYTPDNLTNQPYKFDSTVTITNLGYEKLDLWELSIEFVNREIISEAAGVLFLSSQTLPGLETDNDTRLVGTTNPNLLTSIDTAHDLDLISTKFDIVGTEFGVNGSGSPLPKSLTLVNKGYDCLANASAPNATMWVCCTENSTAINTTLDGEFLARTAGDIIMSYDIMSASANVYTARVSIIMNDPIGRLDNWNLTWQWTGGELIQSMQGGQVLGPNEQDLCVFGLPAIQYPDEKFSTYQSCSSTPVIIDLDQYQSTNPDAIPYCCRNGTLLPDLIDPLKSRSDFQLTVRKLAPHTLLDDITPPADWNIGEGYKCSQPARVSPAEFEPAALHSPSAVASWQVVCNSTADDKSPKKCCVSFSAYYNDSLVPCPTCSCGCATNKLPWNQDTCNPGIPALELPYQAVLLPPSNRTSLALELASIHHRPTPRDVLPCPDNCGVTLNWHVYSDYNKGWSARLTLFNWDDQAVVNWSAAVQMPVAMPGFQDAYSFNSTKVPLADIKEFSELNNTVFMQGLTQYNNYLIGKDSKDVPGKLQSILSFDKRKTPGINVVEGDGFPKKVWFNGEECQLPEYFPTGNGWRLLPTFQFAIIIAVTIYLMAGETMRFL